METFRMGSWHLQVGGVFTDRDRHLGVPYSANGEDLKQGRKGAETRRFWSFPPRLCAKR